MEFYTIGVYGTTEQDFFATLVKNHIDTFCDIRQRRAVRGATYAYVNAVKLQAHLAKLNIGYNYEKALAAPAEIRQLQMQSDAASGTTQRQRAQLSAAFIKAYSKTILKPFDFTEFITRLKTEYAKKVVLFCVEKNVEACHRGLVAKELQTTYGYTVTHL